MKPKTKRNSFRKQMDEYYRMMAEAGQIDPIKKPRKGWKRMSKKNQAKALYEEQYREWKTYNDY